MPAIIYFLADIIGSENSMRVKLYGAGCTFF